MNEVYPKERLDLSVELPDSIEPLVPDLNPGNSALCCHIKPKHDLM